MYIQLDEKKASHRIRPVRTFKSFDRGDEEKDDLN